MYPIITKKTTAEASSWYGATIIRTPTYAVLPSGKEVFLLNAVTDVVETNKKNNPYIRQDVREDQKKSRTTPFSSRSMTASGLTAFPAGPISLKKYADSVPWTSSSGLTTKAMVFTKSSRIL